jgi:hypothetical protein
MSIREYTDTDGDALTITTDHRGVWITCTSAGAELTVGPFAPGELELGGKPTPRLGQCMYEPPSRGLRGDQRWAWSSSF